LNRPVRFHPDALEEAVAAVRWYAAHSARAGERFLNELSRAIRQISHSPRQFPEYRAGTRRILLRRFPFFVVFRENTTAIDVIAVGHARRRPGYWIDRAD
jgi:toxin ParE1/3/4